MEENDFLMCKKEHYPVWELMHLFFKIASQIINMIFEKIRKIVVLSSVKIEELVPYSQEMENQQMKKYWKQNALSDMCILVCVQMLFAFYVFKIM